MTAALAAEWQALLPDDRRGAAIAWLQTRGPYNFRADLMQLVITSSRADLTALPDGVRATLAAMVELPHTAPGVWASRQDIHAHPSDPLLFEELMTMTRGIPSVVPRFTHGAAFSALLQQVTRPPTTDDWI